MLGGVAPKGSLMFTPTKVLTPRLRLRLPRAATAGDAAKPSIQVPTLNAVGAHEARARTRISSDPPRV